MPVVTLCNASADCHAAQQCLRAPANHRVDEWVSWITPDRDGSGGCRSYLPAEAAAGLRLDQRAG